MLREGHTGLTLTIVAPVAIPASMNLDVYVIGILLVGALLGSILPDFDTRTNVVSHRGFTHTIWFTILSAIVGGGVIYYALFHIPINRTFTFTTTDHILTAIIFGVSVGVGTITHLLGDVITPQGIKPFDPLTPKNILPVTVSEKKYVYEIRNASDPLLNKGFSVLGTLSVVGSGYIISTQIL
jgi:inner membrane protein